MGGSPPGARASRPHNIGKASPNSSTLIDRQRRQGSMSVGPMRFPPAVWSAGRIAGELSGRRRMRMRAGRPRSQVCRPDGAVEATRRAPFGKLPFARDPAPSPYPGSDLTRLKQDFRQ